jgi:hypothetical protein
MTDGLISVISVLQQCQMIGEISPWY